jgi:hypothetical protein
MKSLTDELLGIKHPKFEVGDLVKAKAATNAYGALCIGIVTSVTILRNKTGTIRNVYTIDWADKESTKILWHDWYDEDLILVQPGAEC